MCFFGYGVEVARLSGFRDLDSDLFREADLCCHLTRCAIASPAAKDTEHLVGAHLYPLILIKTSGLLILKKTSKCSIRCQLEGLDQINAKGISPSLLQ